MRDPDYVPDPEIVITVLIYAVFILVAWMNNKSSHEYSVADLDRRERATARVEMIDQCEKDGKGYKYVHKDGETSVVCVARQGR